MTTPKKPPPPYTEESTPTMGDKPSGIMRIGEDTPRKAALLICKAWVIVAIAAQAMVLTVWLMIMIQNLNVFRKTIGLYLGNDVMKYPPSDAGNGYVNNTNIPKHLGGAVFAAVFDCAMMIFVLLSTCADLFWKYPICQRVLIAMFTPGLCTEEKVAKIEYFFLWANALIKIFISAATGAQTFVGLNPNNPDVNTPLFCLYATFILLGSAPFTMIAFQTIIQRKKVEEGSKA